MKNNKEKHLENERKNKPISFLKKSAVFLAFVAILAIAPLAFVGCGSDGKDGQNGKDAAQWYYGKESPISGNHSGNVGDFYIDTDDNIIYQLTSTGWVVITNLGTGGSTGPQGPQGEQGQDGTTPHIGGNGNWWIGETDTGVNAKAEDGVGVKSISSVYKTNSQGKEVIEFTFEMTDGSVQVVECEVPLKVDELVFISETDYEVSEIVPELKVCATYSDGSKEDIVVTSDMYVVEENYDAEVNFNEKGVYNIKIKYKNKTVSVTINIKNQTTQLGDQKLEVVSDFKDMVYTAKSTISSGGGNLTTNAQVGRSCSLTTVLKVNGGETINFNQCLNDTNLYWSLAEYTALPLTDHVNPRGKKADSWLQSSFTLQEDTKYILICFKNEPATTFTETQLASLPMALEFANKKVESLQEKLSNKNLSILGDSISTYQGYSNNASTSNNTTGSNAVYYTGSNILTSVDETWWKQSADETGMNILVNNSYSGDRVTQKGQDRCLQLHDNTGENAGTNPDIIATFLGINDYNWKEVSVSQFETSYDRMISKMVEKYSEADIFLFTIFPNGRRNDDVIIEFNDIIKNTAKKYGCKIVDIYENSGLNSKNYLNFTEADGNVHPNQEGMDLITKCFLDVLYNTYVAI